VKTIEVDPRVTGIRDEIPLPQAKQCSLELDSPSCQFKWPFSQEIKCLQEKLIVTARTHDTNDGVAQHGGHTPNRLIETCSLDLPCSPLILDFHVMITDTCQNKVSAEQYHLPISRAQVFSSLRFTWFWRWPLTWCWFSIGSRAHIWITCWKQGRIVLKPANANPGLKVNQNTTFSSIQMSFTALFSVYGDYAISKQKARQDTKKPHC